MPVQISWPCVVATIVPNVGLLGGFITRKNINPWYESLKKPTWTPPKWAFAPVWTTLYCSMGYASHLVLRDCGSWKNAAVPMSIYGTNLILNWAWTPIFFGMHKIDWATYEIFALWGTTLALTVAFYKVNQTAGLLVLPYLAWNTLATALTFTVYKNNKNNNTSTSAIEDKKK